MVQIGLHVRSRSGNPARSGLLLFGGAAAELLTPLYGLDAPKTLVKPMAMLQNFMTRLKPLTDALRR